MVPFWDLEKRVTQPVGRGSGIGGVLVEVMVGKLCCAVEMAVCCLYSSCCQAKCRESMDTLAISVKLNNRKVF